MQHELFDDQQFDLNSALKTQEGVYFDPDNIRLQGTYADEISAFRARRLWIDSLELNFLLERNQDFRVSVKELQETQQFLLTCDFVSACARYAFWRLTNNQVPEVQYVIETAHIPVCRSRHEEIMTAPDLRPMHTGPLVTSGHPELGQRRKPFMAWFQIMFRRLRSS